MGAQKGRRSRGGITEEAIARLKRAKPIRGGLAYGATDDLGYHAAHDGRRSPPPFCNLLGFDHRVTYHLQGRDERLTDVYARVITRGRDGRPMACLE